MKNTIIHIKQQLHGIYPEEEIQAIIFIIFEHVINFSKTDVLINYNTKLNEIEQNQIFRITERLKKNEPIQYILGNTEFYGRKFLVNSSVLIPRQETEQLVDLACKLYEKASNIQILDLGTGSGCIAISLALHYSNAQVTATDISTESLKLAEKNAMQKNAAVTFIHDDMLNTKLQGQFNIILSNPPYIIPAQKAEMHKNVLDFEPEKALFVPAENPLLFYEAIAQIADKLLIEKGFCLVEINEIFGKETMACMKTRMQSSVKVIKDFAGKDRFICLQKY
jgi:release factor glutamine methyltransferase